MDAQSHERPLHHTLIFLAGAIAMLGALLAVANVSGSEPSDRPSPLDAARQREIAYLENARTYCSQMLLDADRPQEPCVQDQAAAAREVYRLTFPMRDDDPRRRIFGYCERAFGADMSLRLACFEEQLGELQFNVGWVPRSERRR
jgi:hypothetical protein